MNARQRRRRSGPAWLLVAALVLAGCGGSSGHGKAASQVTVVTVPAYGGFHATTETVTQGTPATCRRDAQAFARDAASFLAPSTLPTDQYYISARGVFIDFEAHRCDVAYLRTAIARRLSPKQRRTLAARLPFLGKTPAGG